MLRVNEYNIEPGVYRHYKGNYYVVSNLVTHMDGPDGKMQKLEDPLVCYHDVEKLPQHINGKTTTAYEQTYARTLSEFNAIITTDNGSVRRFEKEPVTTYSTDNK